MNKTLDALDRKIVALVAANGRISHEDIARRVFVSRPTVHERVKRLEQDGVIRGYRAVVDWAAIDLGLCGFVSVQIEHEQMSEVLSTLLEVATPRALIEECHRVTGQWCVLLKVRAASPEALQDLLDRIHAVPGVSQLLTSVVLTSLDAQAAPTAAG
jgi:Lrp/AsnC family leucine-responsive transcriptional regulator